jgi:AraC family transcriptional regulator, dual regulator of chb operon
MDIYKITEAEHIDPEIEANPNFITSIKYTVPVHCHDYYEFFLVTKGKCIHKINGVEQYLTEGVLEFIRPNDVHSYHYYNNEDCQFINIACSNKAINDMFEYLGEEFFEKTFLNNDIPTFVNLSTVEKENIISRYERLKVLSTIDKSQARLQLRSMLVEIFTQYFQGNESVKKKEIPLWLDTLLIQMQKKENFSAGIERMYELSGRSIGHVNRVFRQYLNTTPTGYINELKLNCVKSLLLTTNLSIVDASLEAGFDNLSHFYHLFKKKFNTSPSRIRSGRPKEVLRKI